MIIVKFALGVVTFLAIWDTGRMIRSITDAAEHLDEQVTKLGAFVNDDPRGIKGTFSNANAILVQIGLASDELRRSSMTQREYWDTISKEAVESMHKTNEVLSHLNMVAESLNTTVLIANRKTLPDLNLVLEELRTTTATLGTDSRSLLIQSTASAAAAEKVLLDTDALLTSPDVGKSMDNFMMLTGNLNQSAANVEKTTGYIADMFKPSKKPFWKIVAESFIPIGIKSLIPQRTVVINPVEVKK